MPIRFQILGSSSSGNCALLRTDDCTVLVDAGFSGRKIAGLLELCGTSVQDLDAVFLTHEHGDHACGIKGLARLRPGLRVFANDDTAQAVQRGLLRRPDWQLFQTGYRFRFRDLEVTTFAVPHDAYDPVGFLFGHGGDDLFNPRRTVAWAVDLGHVPSQVAEPVRGADLLVIESNYDPDLLERDARRPWSVKQRIRGRHGHLSNHDARDFLSGVELPRWEHVALAHLSKDCNDVDLVRDFFAGVGASPSGGEKFAISVVDPSIGTAPAYTWDGLKVG